MTIKQKIVALSVVLGLMIGFAGIFPAGTAFAEDAPATTGQPVANPEGSCTADSNCCNGVKTSIIGGDAVCGSSSSDSSSAENSTIWHLLIAALNIMTAGIGIAAVGGIVYGALLYTTAEDKPDQTKKAIGIITNVVIGLVAYALMFVLLNFLIPGGIFKA